MAETVLIVDHEEAVREIISSMLISGGFKFLEAKTGNEALSLMESGTTVDVVVSELMMPEMDGITLLERIRQKFPDVPFIFATAVRDNDVLGAAIRYGARDYLLKPFERNQLLMVVRRALDERGNPPDATELSARIRREMEVL